MECDSIKSNVNRSSTISIHAPRMECNLTAVASPWMPWNFNPRTREGCDILFSCHDCFGRNFNPRTREGCDHYSSVVEMTMKGFQSTHPRGVRRFRLHVTCVTSEFQSTHPRGVRPATLRMIAGEFSISIHAPARGATKIYLQCLTALYHFNPRTREGCDRIITIHIVCTAHFNPRTPYGVRLVFMPDHPEVTNNFNPRTPYGVRQTSVY